MKQLLTTLFILFFATWALAQEPGQTETSPAPDTALETADSDTPNGTATAMEDQAIDEMLQALGDELSGWSEEDRRELLDSLESLRDIDIDFSSGPGETLIALVAIIFSLGMPIIIIGIVAYAGYRKKKLVFQTLDQYISSGRDIPPEVLKVITGDTEKNHLQGGLITTGVALGIMIFAAVIGVMELVGIAAIVLCIGLAKLLIWKLEKRSEQAPLSQ